MHLVGSMAYKNKKNAQTAMFYMFFRHWFQILWRQWGWIQEMSQGLAQGVGVKQQNSVKDNNLSTTTRKLNAWPIGKVLHFNFLMYIVLMFYLKKSPLIWSNIYHLQFPIAFNNIWSNTTKNTHGTSNYPWSITFQTRGARLYKHRLCWIFTCADPRISEVFSPAWLPQINARTEEVGSCSPQSLPMDLSSPFWPLEIPVVLFLINSFTP